MPEIEYCTINPTVEVYCSSLNQPMPTTIQHRSHARHWAVATRQRAAMWTAFFQSSPPFRQARIFGDFYGRKKLIFKEVCSVHYSCHVWSCYSSGVIRNSYWHGKTTLEKSSRDFSCILHSFLDSNYRQIRRSSQKTEWASFPAEVLWVSSRLHKPLPADQQTSSQKWSHQWTQNAELQTWPKRLVLQAGSLRKKQCWRSQVFLGWELAYL